MGFDMRKGQFRAVDVGPPDDGSVTAQARQESASQNIKMTGTVGRNTKSSGWISQDSGLPDLFCLPSQCLSCGGEVPSVGTRVQYLIGINPVQLAPMAFSVELERKGKATGTIENAKGHEFWSFIKQDSGGSNIFVLPSRCTGFDNKLPEQGT